jgi:hypothetical protein
MVSDEFEITSLKLQSSKLQIISNEMCRDKVPSDEDLRDHHK